MPNIKPVSDLRNYATVLRDVSANNPVYLTKNGYGRYAIVDIEDQEKYQLMEAALKLYTEIEKGHRSGEEEGWIEMDAANELIEEMISRHEG